MNEASLRAGVAIGGDPASLDAVAARDVALAVWRRRMPDSLRAGLDALDPDAVDDIACAIDADAAVTPMLHAAGYPAAIAAPLAQDVALLVRRHAALTGADRLHVRLDVIETDACRRFHADHVTLRLLCTYVGPGTQWCHADRPDTIGAVSAGDVAVFKGRLLLDPPCILHRSPPIVARGLWRLMLAIDPVAGAGMSGLARP